MNHQEQFPLGSSAVAVGAEPASTTHRLCFFEGAPPSHKHTIVPNYVADEVEELRAFVRFLFPKRGQDRFVLQRPDCLDFVWTVWDRQQNRAYTAGRDPFEAVNHARSRLGSEDKDAAQVSANLSESPQPYPYES